MGEHSKRHSIYTMLNGPNSYISCICKNEENYESIQYEDFLEKCDPTGMSSLSWRKSFSQLRRQWSEHARKSSDENSTAMLNTPENMLEEIGSVPSDEEEFLDNLIPARRSISCHGRDDYQESMAGSSDDLQVNPRQGLTEDILEETSPQVESLLRRSNMSLKEKGAVIENFLQKFLPDPASRDRVAKSMMERSTTSLEELRDTLIYSVKLNSVKLDQKKSSVRALVEVLYPNESIQRRTLRFIFSKQPEKTLFAESDAFQKVMDEVALFAKQNDITNDKTRVKIESILRASTLSEDEKGLIIDRVLRNNVFDGNVRRIYGNSMIMRSTTNSDETHHNLIKMLSWLNLHSTTKNDIITIILKDYSSDNDFISNLNQYNVESAINALTFHNTKVHNFFEKESDVHSRKSKFRTCLENQDFVEERSDVEFQPFTTTELRVSGGENCCENQKPVSKTNSQELNIGERVQHLTDYQVYQCRNYTTTRDALKHTELKMNLFPDNYFNNYLDPKKFSGKLKRNKFCTNPTCGVKLRNDRILKEFFQEMPTDDCRHKCQKGYHENQTDRSKAEILVEQEIFDGQELKHHHSEVCIERRPKKSIQNYDQSYESPATDSDITNKSPRRETHSILKTEGSKSSSGRSRSVSIQDEEEIFDDREIKYIPSGIPIKLELKKSIQNYDQNYRNNATNNIPSRRETRLKSEYDDTKYLKHFSRSNSSISSYENTVIDGCICDINKISSRRDTNSKFQNEGTHYSPQLATSKLSISSYKKKSDDCICDISNISSRRGTRSKSEDKGTRLTKPLSRSKLSIFRKFRNTFTDDCICSINVTPSQRVTRSKSEDEGAQCPTPISRSQSNDHCACSIDVPPRRETRSKYEDEGTQYSTPLSRSQISISNNANTPTEYCFYNINNIPLGREIFLKYADDGAQIAKSASGSKLSISKNTNILSRQSNCNINTEPYEWETSSKTEIPTYFSRSKFSFSNLFNVIKSGVSRIKSRKNLKKRNSLFENNNSLEAQHSRTSFYSRGSVNDQHAPMSARGSYCSGRSRFNPFKKHKNKISRCQSLPPVPEYSQSLESELSRSSFYEQRASTSNRCSSLSERCRYNSFDNNDKDFSCDRLASVTENRSSLDREHSINSFNDEESENEKNASGSMLGSCSSKPNRYSSEVKVVSSELLSPVPENRNSLEAEHSRTSFYGRGNVNVQRASRSPRGSRISERSRQYSSEKRDSVFSCDCLNPVPEQKNSLQTKLSKSSFYGRESVNEKQASQSTRGSYRNDPNRYSSSENYDNVISESSPPVPESDNSLKTVLSRRPYYGSVNANEQLASKSARGSWFSERSRQNSSENRDSVFSCDCLNPVSENRNSLETKLSKSSFYGRESVNEKQASQSTRGSYRNDPNRYSSSENRDSINSYQSLPPDINNELVCNECSNVCKQMCDDCELCIFIRILKCLYKQMKQLLSKQTLYRLLHYISFLGGLMWLPLLVILILSTYRKNDDSVRCFVYCRKC